MLLTNSLQFSSSSFFLLGAAKLFSFPFLACCVWLIYVANYLQTFFTFHFTYTLHAPFRGWRDCLFFIIFFFLGWEAKIDFHLRASVFRDCFSCSCSFLSFSRLCYALCDIAYFWGLRCGPCARQPASLPESEPNRQQQHGELAHM